MCKFVFLTVCREYDKDWADDDGLIFRNFQSGRSTSTVSSIQLPGIYGLKGCFESEPDKCIITIYLFAEKSKFSFPFIVDAVTISSN